MARTKNPQKCSQLASGNYTSAVDLPTVSSGNRGPPTASTSVKGFARTKSISLAGDSLTG